MDFMRLERVEARESDLDLQCYVMEQGIPLFFGPSFDCGPDGTVPLKVLDHKTIRRFGEWSRAEISLDAQTGEFASLLLLTYMRPLLPLSEADDEILPEKGVPFFVFENLPEPIGRMKNVYEDSGKEVSVEAGAESIRIVFADFSVARRVEVAGTLQMEVSEHGKLVAARFDGLKQGDVDKLRARADSYRTQPSRLERFLAWIRR